MALSFWQKLKLSIRVWLRRRDEAAERRRREFISGEIRWDRPSTPVESSRAGAIARFDLDGLQLAWLDDSRAFAYFLDVPSGEVWEIPVAERERIDEAEADPRLHRVPTRSVESDDHDRREFIETRDGPIRLRLATALTADDPSTEFRRVVSSDRNAERAWFAFRNERSLDAIEEWLASIADDENLAQE